MDNDQFAPANPIIDGLQDIEISQEMRRSYLNYAMSVIVSRALPDIRDGLKPVHRRILFAMHKLGLTYGGRYSKSAKVVGEVLGKYHPHGDSPVYDALVRMAQEFSMRYPLVLGQGNFGSIDGDPPAAMRYTEVKLMRIADEMISDIDKDTVEWEDNFDATLKEPTYMPAKIPNLLLMGAEGIAVGMATRIPPHNLTEVLDGTITMIDSNEDPYASGEHKPEEELHSLSYTPPSEWDILFEELQEITPKSEEVIPAQYVHFKATLEDLMQHIKGPDFPTAAIMYGQKDIQEAYATGRGKLLLRAKVDLEESKGGKESIIITELPYQTNKANLIKKIADLVRDKKLVGISDLRDESDRDGIRVVIELKRDAAYNKVVNNLFKHTELQTTYPVNMVAIVNKTPLTVSLQVVLEEYLKHRIHIIRRRSIFDLRAAGRRAHILEGLLKALDHIDEIIAIIKKAQDESIARAELMSKFAFTHIQAQAILDMQLKRLTGLERAKLEEELKKLHDQMSELKKLIMSVFNILAHIKQELTEIKEKYGDARRTKIIRNKPGELSDEQLIENHEVIVTMTNEGYIKSVAKETFKVQKRGGKGVSGMTTKDEDGISYITACQTHDYILFFSNRGKVYQTRVWEVPSAMRNAKGKAVVNLIGLEQGETVTSILTVSPEMIEQNSKYNILMCTEQGTIKKSPLSDFRNIRASGLIAINLSTNDRLMWGRLTDGEQNVLIATQQGKAIVFQEADVRSMGRTAHGVRGIALEDNDKVTSVDVYDAKDKEKRIVVLSEKGIGKTSKISLFPVQKRGGKGVKIATIDQKTGPIAFSGIIDEAKEMLLITSKQAQVVKLDLASLPTLSRTAKGVILMRFSDTSDSIVSATMM